MTALTLIVIVIILFVILRFINKKSSNITKEEFSTSPGTVVQLMAKGRHDQYLTGPHAGDSNPLDKLIPEATKTKRLPAFYIGWYPNMPDFRRQ